MTRTSICHSMYLAALNTVETIINPCRKHSKSRGNWYNPPPHLSVPGIPKDGHQFLSFHKRHRGYVANDGRDSQQTAADVSLQKYYNQLFNEAGHKSDNNPLLPSESGNPPKNNRHRQRCVLKRNHKLPLSETERQWLPFLYIANSQPFPWVHQQHMSTVALIMLVDSESRNRKKLPAWSTRMPVNFIELPKLQLIYDSRLTGISGRGKVTCLHSLT